MPMISPSSTLLSFRAIALAAGLASALAGAALAQDWVPVSDFKAATGLTKHASGTVEYSQAGVLKTSGNGGYLRTNKEYTHFRTKIEWNNNTGGNTGFLFHILEDRVWPLGLECQMHSDDVGSLWTTGCKFNSTGSGNTFNPTGNALTGYGTTGTNRNQFVRALNPGAAVNAWSTWEMYVKGDSLEIKCNDKLVMRVWKISINNGTALVKGKIGLQIEGATVQWRNWVIQDLSEPSGIALPKDRIMDGARQARLFVGSAGPGLSTAASVGIPDAASGFRLADLNGRSLRILPASTR